MFYIQGYALPQLILSISQGRKLRLSEVLLAKFPLSSIGTQVCLPREGIRGPDWCLQPSHTSSRVGLTKPVVQGVSLEEGLPLDLQFRGLGPGLYPAVPTVPRGTAPKGMEFALTSPWGQRRRRRPGAWRANSSPSPPKVPQVFWLYSKPSRKWAKTSASSKGPSWVGGWGAARQGRRRGLLCGAHSQGFLGINHLKAGEACNFIPWEEEPEKSASGVGMKCGRGEERPGELFREGRDLARSPKPSPLSKLSPNSWPPPSRNQNTTSSGGAASGAAGRADSRRH